MISEPPTFLRHNKCTAIKKAMKGFMKLKNRSQCLLGLWVVRLKRNLSPRHLKNGKRKSVLSRKLALSHIGFSTEIFPDIVVTYEGCNSKVETKAQKGSKATTTTSKNLTVPKQLPTSGMDATLIQWTGRKGHRKSTHLCVENETVFDVEKKKLSLPSRLSG